MSSPANDLTSSLQARSIVKRNLKYDEPAIKSCPSDVDLAGSLNIESPTNPQFVSLQGKKMHRNLR